MSTQTLVIVDPVHSGEELARSAVGLEYDVLPLFTVPRRMVRPELLRDLGVRNTYFDTDVQRLLRVIETECEARSSAVCGVIAGAEPAVEIASLLAHRLGLPGLNPAITSALRNKDEMRFTLAAQERPTPKYQVCGSASAAHQAATTMGYPLVCKRPSGAGGCGVALVANLDELDAYLTNAFEDNLFGQKTNRILCESYLPGEEFIVDLFADGAGEFGVMGVWKYSYFKGFVKNIYRSIDPTSDDAVALINEAKACCAALGITLGPIHCELKMAPGEHPVLVEAGARLAGANVPELYRLGGGFDPFVQTILAFTQGHCDLTRLKKANRHIASVFPTFEVRDDVGVLTTLYGRSIVEGMESCLRPRHTRHRRRACRSSDKPRYNDLLRRSVRSRAASANQKDRSRMNMQTATTQGVLGSLPIAPAMTEDTPALLPAFQAALHQIGFDEERIRARLGYQWVIPLADDLENLDTPYASEEDMPTLDRFIKLFVLGEAVPADPMRTALGEKAWRFVLETGLAHLQDELLWPNVYLMSWQGFWVTADLTANQAVEDAVFIPDQSAVMMSGMIAPREDEPKRSMLDIGTGSGILALLASVHFDSVVAVDINPRALAFTRFNAALNTVDITCEVSSFERLSQGTERFDLVTFAMPLLYPYFRRNASAVHTRSANGDTLLTEAYGALDGVLSARGRAVYWHQVLIQPEGHFQSRLAQIETLQGFDILSNQFNLGSDTWSFSRTLVKRVEPRRTGFALSVVPAPADPINHFQKRDDLYRYTGSVSKLAKGDVQDTQIIRRYDHISISRCYDSLDGTWQEPRATISGAEVSIEVSEHVHKIGKGLSVATFLDWFADRRDPQSQGRAALSELVCAGFVYLDAS